MVSAPGRNNAQAVGAQANGNEIIGAPLRSFPHHVASRAIEIVAGLGSGCQENGISESGGSSCSHFRIYQIAVSGSELSVRPIVDGESAVH
jgi:hypothetical protein